MLGVPNTQAAGACMRGGSAREMWRARLGGREHAGGVSVAAALLGLGVLRRALHEHVLHPALHEEHGREHEHEHMVKHEEGAKGATGAEREGWLSLPLVRPPPSSLESRLCLFSGTGAL